ncbi:MAG: glycosyltransferase family 4 protein [Muribaculaceae bacterium]|nr:glycosyltransferase family 4 protein [Muribaculaceae bacterium]
MKIVYCLAGTFNSGGMERIVINKANWLAEHGNEVYIVTTEQKGRKDFFPLSKGVTRIDLNILYSETNNYSVFKKAFARRKLIKKHKLGLSKVLNEIKPDIVISTFGNEVGFLHSIKDGCRKIAEIHFSRWYRLQLNRKGIWRLIDKYLTYTDSRVLNKYDKFVCLTQEDKQNWEKSLNIEVIPNFIDQSNNNKADLQSKSMIAVGRFSYQKGYDRLVRAWSLVAAKYPDWELNIFGEGELKEIIQQQIDDLYLSNSINIHAPSSDIMSEYAKNSALIMSSRYEGLPMVLLEAASIGLPLISFACQCGPRDVINDGYNGFLVDNGDIQGLANAIIQLIENPSLRKSMGEKAYEKSTNYHKDLIMKRWVDLFQSLIQ